MLASILGKVIEILLKLLTPDLLKKFADIILDFAEDFVLGTKSEIDDKMVLPLCALIRETFGIEDKDEQ